MNLFQVERGNITYYDMEATFTVVSVFITERKQNV